MDCMHEADVESDEQDVAGWLKVSPPVSERWCKKFGGQAGLTSKGCGEKACLGCGMAECDSSFVYSTVRAFARKEDNLADDEHHHSCWLIGKAAYAPAYNTDEVSACEAATTGGAAAAVRSAHTVLASRRRAERRRPCDRPTLSSPRRL